MLSTLGEDSERKRVRDKGRHQEDLRLHSVRAWYGDGIDMSTKNFDLTMCARICRIYGFEWMELLNDFSRSWIMRLMRLEIYYWQEKTECPKNRKIWKSSCSLFWTLHQKAHLASQCTLCVTAFPKDILTAWCWWIGRFRNMKAFFFSSKDQHNNSTWSISYMLLSLNIQITI